MSTYAVIMAGGSGERFWPVSRKERPKQLLRLTHPDETLLEEAVNRIAPLIPRERVLIATGLPLKRPIQEAQLVSDDCVLAEPAKRNTLGCLAWVAANMLAKYSDQDVTLAILTADHKIGEPDLFRETVARAVSVAEKTGGLVTIGIRPSRPETGYGYVAVGDALDTGQPSAYRVLSFREKPDRETAEHYVESGNYLWNSGMFFWTLKGFLAEMSHANPDVYATILSMSRDIADGNDVAAHRSFEFIPNESIDYALLEKAHQVYTVAGEFPWDDVGAWDALERSMPCTDDANVVHGEAVTVETCGSIIYNDNPDLLIAAIGVEDHVIVATKGAVMICPKSEAQRVKEILQKLPSDSPLR